MLRGCHELSSAGVPGQGTDGSATDLQQQVLGGRLSCPYMLNY